MKRRQRSDVVHSNTRPESSKQNAIHGGNVVHHFPLNVLVYRMAQKVLHDRIHVKKKQSRENGHQRRSLTNEQVREIRKKHSEGQSTASLAQEYNCTKGYICAIISFNARALA